MSFRVICSEIKQKLPPSKEISKSLLEGNHIEFRSLEKLNPSLREYEPVMKVNLENVSSGESSPCHSDYEKPTSKRKKDLTLYSILDNYLDGSTVEEFQYFHPNSHEFDWVVIMGFIDDEQVNRTKEILANTECKKKIRFTKKVFYKGFRSCLFECDSFEDAKFTYEFILGSPLLAAEIKTNLWGALLRSKFKDVDFQNNYNAIVVKNIPPQFTTEVFKHILSAECPQITPKSIDVLTYIENTIATVINFYSLEEAELMCQRLNNKLLQHEYVLKAALVGKPEFKHQNKDNSIFKDYLIEPRKKMIEKLMNSRHFKSQGTLEGDSKKNNVADLLELFGKKIQSNPQASDQKSVVEVSAASTNNSNLTYETQVQNTWQYPIQHMAQPFRTEIPGFMHHRPLPGAPYPQNGMHTAPNPYPGFQFPGYPYYHAPPMMPPNFYYGFPNFQGNMPIDYYYPIQNHMHPQSGFSGQSAPSDPSKQSTSEEGEYIQKKVFSEKDHATTTLKKTVTDKIRDSPKKKKK